MRLINQLIIQFSEADLLSVYVLSGFSLGHLHMGGQVQGDKALMGGLMRGDIDLMGRANFDRLYHNLKVLLWLS